METTMLLSSETCEANDSALNELSELQLSLVGGGSADVILA